MKKLVWILIGMISLVHGQTQERLVKPNRFELSAGYKLGVPMGHMGHYIQRGHGFMIQGFFKPNSKFPIWIGGNLDVIVYGSKKTPQEYVFSDGTVANTTVDVSSSISTYQLLLKYPFHISQTIEPYVMLGMGGASFSTDLYIEDPRYEDECVALEQEHLHRSKTYAITPSLGAKFNISKHRSVFIDFNVGYSLGSEVSFMNPTLGEDMTNPNHNHNAHAVNGEVVTPYYVDFINRRTQVVHKHHVGNIYHSTFQMLNLRIGIGMNF